MSGKTKSELFLDLLEEYLYAREQLRDAKGFVSHGLVESVPDEVIDKFQSLEEKAGASLLKMLDDVFKPGS